MDSERTSSVLKRQFEACSEAVKQLFFLLLILKELFYLLLSVARGSLSLEDAHVRIQAIHSDYAKAPEKDRCDPPISPSPDTEGNLPTSDGSDPIVGSSKLMGSVRILCRAIVQRDVEAVSRILEAAPFLVGKRHEGGWFELHAAVLSGDIEIVKLILACPDADITSVYKSTGASVDIECELGTHVEDTSGATVLHFACMVGNAEIIRLLVEHGAFFEHEDDKKRVPVEYFSILHDLEAADKFEVFEDSIRKNPDLTSKMVQGNFTLLHPAVIRQHRRFVELLVSMDQSLVNECDRRADYTSESLHISFAPPTIPHTYVKNATPLHYACLVQDMGIAEMLLEAGADWNIKDFKGRTPEELIRAVDESCNEVKSAFIRLLDNERCEAEEDRMEGGRNSYMEAESFGDSISQCEFFEGDGHAGMDYLPSKVHMDSLLSLEDETGAKLVGKLGPIHLVANAIRLRESGWVDPDRPLTMLFLGSSGVGKTDLAKQLALYLHGKDGKTTNKGQSIADLEKAHGFVRIDMSEFQEEHTVLNLIGAPKSYIGYEDGSTLTQPLKKNPKAVVLLDEIEKAHLDVLVTFLQVFDDGRITDSKDGTIFCKDAIFIMTPNIAAETIKKAAPTLRQEIARSEKEGRLGSYIHIIQNFTRSNRPELIHHLERDEFVGRINQIVVFLPLSQEEIKLAIHRELETWRKRSEEKHKINLTWTGEVVEKLAESYDVNYGVRSVVNEVQRIVVQLVADAYIRGRISDYWRAELTVNEVGDIVMNARPDSEDCFE
ncbi:hypothetical protein ACEPAI_3520 [Sanghuangporus weigelae]